MSLLASLIAVWLLAVTVVSSVITMTSARAVLPTKYGVITPDNRTLCPCTQRLPNRVYTEERLASLRLAMNKANLQAYITYNRDEHGRASRGYYSRLAYISGFSGSNGYAIVTENLQTEHQNALWTDGRYFTQADQQMDCNWILMKSGQPGYPSGAAWLSEVLSFNSRVGAFPNYITTATWQWYERALAKKNITLEPVGEDLVDVIWTDPTRSSIPNNRLIVHPIEFTGLSWEQKFHDVRVRMTSEGVGGLVITVLEQIAWLFNLRGTDKFNSVFYSYAILLQDSASLYVRDPDTLLANDTVTQHLKVDANGTCTKTDRVNCIFVYKYERAIDDIANVASSTVLWIDPTSNYAVYNAAGDKRHVSDSPIELMKSVKNFLERKRFEQCIVRDSAALVEFAAFLEKEINAGKNWTELEASAKLEQIRSTYDYFIGVSFPSVSAFADNAAIIHYRPVPETNKQIDKTSVYLLDSGGQYMDGTTDITRTFHYGTPSDQVKDAYTRVLMGQIELATTVWPAGLYGNYIDMRARIPLWQNGMDYNHGTGHGVGYWLNVHEGPGSISTHGGKVSLREGMFFSDEPGYYEEGNYGIRLETLVTVVKANTTYQFGGKQFLTFKYLSLVPYEPHLINYALMSSVHVEWLNEYHRRCKDEVGQYLLDRDKRDAYDWLVARTKPVPVVGVVSTTPPVNRRMSAVWLLLSYLFTCSQTHFLTLVDH